MGLCGLGSPGGLKPCFLTLSPPKQKGLQTTLVLVSQGGGQAVREASDSAFPVAL